MIRRTAIRRRDGVVLLAVLIVLVLLSLAAYQYSDLMTAEFKASDNYHKAAQARAFADSGIFYAAAQLSNADNLTNNLSNNPFDNEEAFKDIAVGGDDAKGPAGRFSLIAPPDLDNGDTSSTPRYGVVDEGGKININALMKRDPSGQQLYNLLIKLPNMTDEIANSIIFWADPTAKQRSGAAGDDYYSSQNPPYHARNGPLDTIDELLLVRGVTPQLLYGNDLNRNGILDPEEDDGSGTLDRGWATYLTVHSREQNLNSQGQPPANINGDLKDLYQVLTLAVGEDLAKFIVLYRQYGSGSGQTVQVTLSMGSSSSGQGQQSTKGGSNAGGTFSLTFSNGGGNNSRRTQAGKLSSYTPDFTVETKNQIASMFDLVGATVTVPGKTPQDPSTVYSSPLSNKTQARDLLPKLFDAASIFPESEIPARINVNTAPREVLAALPGLTDADVQTLLSVRPKPGDINASDLVFQTLTWLYTDANLKTSTLKNLQTLITTRTQVYRVQAVGYFDNGQGPAARVEAIIDTNGGRPRILSYRDLTDLGKTVIAP